MNKSILTQKIKDKALSLGFSKVGITTAEDFPEYAEELLKRSPNYDFVIKMPKSPFNGAYPKTLMPEAKSIICLAFNYSDICYPENLTKMVGRAYQSRSYLPLSDSINGARVSLLKDFLRNNGCNIGEDIQVPERIACARAGIVTFGSNTFAYAEGCGSFIILSCIVVDMELEYDVPTLVNACPPNCRICIDACPTKAIAEPGKMIPQRCIAFNHWAAKFVPFEIRELNGGRIHGCDICQEVCPRNKKSIKNAFKIDPFLEMLDIELDLEKVLLMDDTYYERVVHPIMYNYIKSKKVFQRNAAIALGNSGDEKHVPALSEALKICDPLVREYTAWALGNIVGEISKSALLQGLEEDQTENVREAIIIALKNIL